MNTSTPFEPPTTAREWLILVPTALERERLELPAGLPVELAGFGPLAAAASASFALSRHQPQRVLLVGIAGSFDPEALPVGTATSFGEVACDGVGVGAGPAALLPSQLGFPQLDGERPIFERTPLAGAGGLLVTAPSASANTIEAGARRARFPGALAEDMEAFGVALACHLAGVELFVVRGLSNVVGEREKSTWQIEAALAAAGTLARKLIGA